MFANVTAGPQEAKQYWGRCYCSFITFIARRFIAGVSNHQAVQQTRWMYLFCREPLFPDSWDGHESVSPANYMVVSPDCMLPWKHSHFSAVRRCWRTSKGHYLVALTHIEQRGAPWFTMPKHNCWVSTPQFCGLSGSLARKVWMQEYNGDKRHLSCVFSPY